jgi:hypothetical protein
MPASGGLLGCDPEGELPRLLPKDHRVRLASAEMRQLLAQVELDLGRFGVAWFSDPPCLEGGREAVSDLVLTADRIRRAARELEALCRTLEP